VTGGERLDISCELAGHRPLDSMLGSSFLSGPDNVKITS